jgi:CubicO group peptidase (beta-lactamase class C family)
VTKQMTASAVLTLVDQGKLALNGRLQSIWPEFDGRITIEHLLRHQSGLADYEEHLPPGTAQVKDAEVLTILRAHAAPRFAPGSKFEYSNSGYVLLGQIVEKMSGQRFGDYLAKTFFEPLGMSCVAHEEGRTRVAQRAYGQPKDQSRTSATLGDGGVYCSLDGLEKWLASPYAFDARMLAPSLGDYGMGWFVRQDRIWHTGTTVGFRNAIVRDRMTGVTVVVLANRSDVDALAVAQSHLRRTP